jgi:hypothetical protein
MRQQNREPQRSSK